MEKLKEDGQAHGRHLIATLSKYWPIGQATTLWHIGGAEVESSSSSRQAVHAGVELVPSCSVH